MKKLLGKITKATLGFGGYDSAMFGMHLVFKVSEGDGFQHFVGFFPRADSEEKIASTKKEILRVMEDVYHTVKSAKKTAFHELPGTPVEVCVEDNGNKLISWRVLDEVL